MDGPASEGGMVGAKRMNDRITEFIILERCPTCRYYGGNTLELLFWALLEIFTYALAPLSALIALVHVDLEWLFPYLAIRLMLPGFLFVGPIFFTINTSTSTMYSITSSVKQSTLNSFKFSYTVYWIIDLAIDVQQVSEDLLNMDVWKRCLWASTLLIANIYALLLTSVVLQLIYYQHYIIIEENVCLLRH
ncbi:unnamed protein product [Thelazia callipaeda]|uniref:Lysosomal cobalamin transporter n=1 Tax=Thelazia callipaeda TaxID=103827 RepID=A0A0N5D3S6_THECL|nr:unnamed protein product [Thelazia callipaeda]